MLVQGRPEINALGRDALCSDGAPTGAIVVGNFAIAAPGLNEPGLQPVTGLSEAGEHAVQVSAAVRFGTVDATTPRRPGNRASAAHGLTCSKRHGA